MDQWERALLAGKFQNKHGCDLGRKKAYIAVLGIYFLFKRRQ